MAALSGEPCDITDSSDEVDAQESVHKRTISRKKKSSRHRGTGLLLGLLVLSVAVT